MKQDFLHIDLTKLGARFSISRQTNYQNSWKAIDSAGAGNNNYYTQLERKQITVKYVDVFFKK